MTEIIIIKVQSNVSKLPIRNQMIDVGTQLSKIIYDGKSLNNGVNGILGKSQTISTKKLKHIKEIIINIPDGGKSDKFYTYIISMVLHAQSKGITIKIK